MISNGGDSSLGVVSEDVNNHVHTDFSFSPYSPSKAIKLALDAGLSTVGIMDHDTLAGAEEFVQAGKRYGMPTTVGMEVRANFSSTSLNGRRINNPDQNSIAYVALHGIPIESRPILQSYMRRYSTARMKRNRIMTQKLNSFLQPHSVSIDFDRDVIPTSKWALGGSMTERHILYALAMKLLIYFGKPKDLTNFLEKNLSLVIPAKIKGLLLDRENGYAVYDLLGLLKSGLMPSFYVEATEECPDINELCSIAKKTGAILAYAYLGDVTDSVTGDKKNLSFEDDYLELLFSTLSGLGFEALTYMPSRNSREQLERIRKYCDMHGLFQISGEDINSPRQSFVCNKMREPAFHNLVESAWALIGHEVSCETGGLDGGMFSKTSKGNYPGLEERTRHFAMLGRNAYNK